MKAADVAAAAQKRFEDVLVDYVRTAVRERVHVHAGHQAGSRRC